MIERELQEEFINIIREDAKCSGNMIKNVRCVTIPNSGGLTGIETACVLGAVAGDASAGMEVLEKVDDAGRERTRELLNKGCCKVKYLDSEIPLHFIIELLAAGHTAEVDSRNHL